MTDQELKDLVANLAIQSAKTDVQLAKTDTQLAATETQLTKQNTETAAAMKKTYDTLEKLGIFLENGNSVGIVEVKGIFKTYTGKSIEKWLYSHYSARQPYRAEIAPLALLF